MMMVSAIGRPSCERSYHDICQCCPEILGIRRSMYLDIVASVVIATFTEQSVGNYAVDVELVKYRICVLPPQSGQCLTSIRRDHHVQHTLLRLAVKTTTS